MGTETTVTKVSNGELSRIITDWGEGKEVPHKTWYAKEKDLFVGVDNTHGECWVEEFYDEKDCIQWCLGEEYPETCEKCGVRSISCNKNEKCICDRCLNK